MPSIIQGYDYDIFISYRQKDNIYDGWVTEFADNLRKELEATIKDKVTIYFDANPDDGILETDIVDQSLKTKLNSLIFIPIISRIYCDPKSYAWNHEFLSFLKLQGNNPPGLSVHLRNGNAASRILPIRIHDLKPEDCKLLEENYGPVRSIDFIYRAPGVNRPLRANEDHPHDNLNKTYYRDQINKVANVIDEIISGLKATQIPLSGDYGSNPENSPQEDQSLNRKTSRTAHHTILKKAGFTLLIFGIIAGLFINRNLFFHEKSESPERKMAMDQLKSALANFDRGNYETAEMQTRLALKWDPEYSYAWSTLAAVSVKKGDLNNAIIQTIEALKFDPLNHEAAYNMAYALEDKKDYIQAEQWYLKAIAIDSGFIPAYSALGRMYNNRNSPIKAIMLLKKAQESNPSSEYIYLIYKNLGYSFLLQDILDSAIKYLELSRTIMPDEDETTYYLAMAYEKSGETEKSIGFWNKYIQTGKDSSRVNEAQFHLKKLNRDN